MALSIEIRNNEVYMIESRVSKSKISIRKNHMFPFDSNYLNQTGVVNKEDLALLLRQHLDQQDIKEKTCTLCLNNASIIYRELLIPMVDDKKIGFLVRNEMMSALNLTPDYIMDFIILEEVKQDDADMYRVLAIAVIEDAITSYLEMMRLVGLKVDIIDSATNAIIKLLEFAEVTSTSQQMIVADVGSGYLRLYLFDDGLYILSRNSRLPEFDELNKETFVDTVEEHISKMIQFSYTRNNKGIASILLMGEDELLPQIQAKIDDTLKVKTQLFSEVMQQQSIDAFPSKYVNTLGVLLRKK